MGTARQRIVIRLEHGRRTLGSGWAAPEVCLGLTISTCTSVSVALDSPGEADCGFVAEGLVGR